MLRRTDILSTVPDSEDVNYSWSRLNSVGVQKVFETSKATICEPDDAVGDDAVSTDPPSRFG